MKTLGLLMEWSMRMGLVLLLPRFAYISSNDQPVAISVLVVLTELIHRMTRPLRMTRKTKTKGPTMIRTSIQTSWKRTSKLEASPLRSQTKTCFQAKIPLHLKICTLAGGLLLPT